MRVIYVVGAPGSGKTTATASALARLGWGSPEQRETPIPHMDYGLSRIQLGRQRDNGFAGTDALGMAINPRAVEFIKTSPAEIVVAEGDRLANRAFLDAASETGSLTLVWIDTAPNLAIPRARERAAILGVEPQNVTWWKGRYTKVARLVGGREHVRIDGGAEPDVVAQKLSEIIAGKDF